MALFFIGGAHGAGKTTLARRLAGLLPATHLTASELIRFKPAPEDPTGKAVLHLASNQSRLISALGERTVPHVDTILDGHFCLITRDQQIVDVPEATFATIGPNALVLVEKSPDEIANQLERRDNRTLDVALLGKLIRRENLRAKEISDALSIPLMTWQAGAPIRSVVDFLAGTKNAE